MNWAHAVHDLLSCVIESELTEIEWRFSDIDNEIYAIISSIALKTEDFKNSWLA